MANAYSYSNLAVQTALAGGVSAVGTSITVTATTGFPVSFPYILALDFGGAAEELVKIISAAGTTLTIDPAGRGFGGTSAQSHSLGAVVRHVYNAVDATDFRTHEASTGAVHGLTGNIVGTTDTQTLSNKTITASTLTSPSVTGTVAGSASYTTPTLTSPTVTGTVAGSASYTSPTLASPLVTGTVSNGGGTTVYDDLFVTGSAAGHTPLAVQLQAAGASFIQTWQDSSSSTVAAVASSGTVQAVKGLSVGTGGQFFVDLNGNVNITVMPPVTLTWTASTTNPTIGNGSITGTYLSLGKLVWLRATIVLGSTSTIGSGSYSFALGGAPAFNGRSVGSGHLFKISGANVRAVVYSSTSGSSLNVDNGSGVTFSSSDWGTVSAGDTFMMTLWYVST